MFFKPHGEHGGAAAYRGDKLTRSVLDTIISSGNYVTQELVAPLKRTVIIDGTPSQLAVGCSGICRRRPCSDQRIQPEPIGQLM